MNTNITLTSKCLGQMQTHCYIVANQQTKEAVVFDPGDEGSVITGYLEENGLTLKAIYLTHGHFDHIMAVPYLLEQDATLPIYLHEEEVEVLENPDLNLSTMLGMNLSLHATNLVKDNEELDVVGAKVVCLHVPGHTKGGVCYYFKEYGWLIAGDTLFKQSIGRTDFPTGNVQALLRGIREQLFTLPDETIVLSGHCPQTTIGEEKQSNPFLR